MKAQDQVQFKDHTHKMKRQTQHEIPIILGKKKIKGNYMNRRELYRYSYSKIKMR